MWHVTHGGGCTFTQNFSFLALTVWDLWCCEDWEEKGELLNELINHEAVYRTAPATPGLLITGLKCICCTLRSWVHQISMLFRTFSPRLEDIDTFQCSSDSFPHWPHISGCVQNCQNYISMYRCSPIAGRRSWKSVPNLSHSYVPFHDLLPAIGEQWYIKM